jgi:predicted membrane metal-binding protein
MAFYAVVALVLLLVGYKWYRIHQLSSSQDATPPSWTFTVWTRTVMLLLFGAIFVWALVEWLIPHPR